MENVSLDERKFMPRIGYNVKLIVDSEEDKIKIIEMLNAANLCWNECSRVRFGMTKNSIVELHKLFYQSFRKSQPKILSQLVITAERSVLATFRSIKSKKHKLDSPPNKKRLSIQLDKRLYSYSYKKGLFSLPTLNGRIKCKILAYDKFTSYFSKYKMCDPLVFMKDGQLYLRIAFDISDIQFENKSCIGVDLGCRINAATSEGKLYVDKKFNADKRKLRYLKRCLHGKASKNSRSAKKHLKKLSGKERNINKNFSHHLSKKILSETKADTIVLENLKSIKVKKGKDKYKNQNRLSQVPLYQLKDFLTYKAPLLGKTVIQVCPSYTSQDDSQTGKRDGVRKGRRYYSSSGKIYDADVNAAINIAKRSKLPYSQGNLLAGQATVRTPIVGLARDR